MRIALDGMGGDFAPQNPIQGALQALQTLPSIETIYLVGPETRLREETAKWGTIPEKLQFINATQVVEMSDSAIDAVRRKKDSSISRAVDLVAEGRADAIVSAGHTGAAVAATTIKLRTLDSVERPGIATVLPTETNLFVLIDSGANIDAKPLHLGQYAIMGSLYSKHVLGFSNPKVGLMSIGTEEIKGNELTKETFKLLSSLPINFKGNIEGHDLFENPVEVVVTDGFVGNVVLKTCESISTAMLHWLKHELMKTPVRKLGALMAQNAFKTIRKKTSYEEFGGSPLLGVNGICIIAHGSSTPRAIKNAIRVATESIQQNLNPHILKAMTQAAPIFYPS